MEIQPPTFRLSLSGPILLLIMALALALFAQEGTVNAQTPHGRPVGIDLEPLSQLLDTNGERFDHASLKGRPFVVFFGFTHCPNICPTTLSDMTADLAELGADADRLTMVFITVDPERDTAAHMKKYLQSFDRRIIGLTGSPIEIAAVASAFGAFYEKGVATDAGTYNVDHSISLFAMDRYGLLARQIRADAPADRRRALFRRLLNQ